MLLFLVCYGAAAGVGELIIRRFPRRLTVLLSFPLLFIASMVAAVAFYYVLSQNPSVESALRMAMLAAGTAAVTMWFSIRRVLQSAEHAKWANRPQEEDDAEEEKIRHQTPTTPTRIEHSSETINRAFEYREDLAREFKRVRSLGSEWEVEFLTAVESNPKADPAAIIREIEVRLEEVYPFREDEVLSLHQSLEVHSPRATREFRKTLFALGDTA